MTGVQTCALPICDRRTGKAELTKPAICKPLFPEDDAKNNTAKVTNCSILVVHPMLCLIKFFIELSHFLLGR